jgi:hypothetical protein
MKYRYGEPIAIIRLFGGIDKHHKKSFKDKVGMILKLRKESL